MHRLLATFLLILLHSLTASCLYAQELKCNVKIIHSQIQGTNKSVFATLETAMKEFMNNKAWTDLQFQAAEKIDCSMTVTIKKYDEAENNFTGELLFQLTRPVYNSNYSTVVFSMQDKNFNFNYTEHDPLEFNPNNLDNNLTAMMAYYAYLFIGMDLDTFSPLGGTDALQIAESIVNNAQTTFGGSGWKAFDDQRNRHAIISDYLDSSMEVFRQMQYKYHRNGLDEMANNVDRGRAAITEAVEMLKEARENRSQSELPVIYTDFKRDELVSIYSGHGTANEKEKVSNILSSINASQGSYWNKITK